MERLASALVSSLLLVAGSLATATPNQVVGFQRAARPDAVELMVMCSGPVQLNRSSGDVRHVRLRLAGVARGDVPAPDEAWAEDVEAVSIEAAEDGTATVVDLRLRRAVPYQVRVRGNALVLVLGRTPAEGARSEASPTPEPAPLPEPIDLPPPPAQPASSRGAAGDTPAPRATRVLEAERLEADPLAIHVATDGVPEYSAFLTEDLPYRLVLDVVGAESRPLFSQLPVNVGPVRAVRIAQHAAGPPAVVRIVFDLDERVAHRILSDPTGLTVVFDGVHIR